MSLQKIIEWCNINQGFTNTVLSLSTIIISITAIVISIVTARTPYKRRLAVSGGTSVGIGWDFTGIHVTAVNVGNIPVMIKTLGIIVKKDVYINIETITESRKMLSPTETTTQYFDKKHLEVFNKLKPSQRAYAFVEDSEGRKHKKYIGKVKMIRKYFCEI